jgi:AcrR family transcriptional regulator
MNKSESKYYNTACLMDNALLELLQKKDYGYITVKEICEKAGVNRSTFYLHYETTDDLLKESLTFIFSKFKDKYAADLEQQLRGKSLEKLNLVTPEYIIPYLEFLSENKKLFMVAVNTPEAFGVKKQFDEIYSKIFNPILDSFGIEQNERKYILAYHMSGMHAIIIEWIRGGCKEPFQYIANLFMKYTSYCRKADEE